MKIPFRKVLKFYRNLPIKRKMLLVLYLQIIIPLFLIGFMSYWISGNILKDRSEAYSQDILKNIQFRIKDRVDNYTSISQELLYDNLIYNRIKGSSEDNLHNADVETPLKKFLYPRNGIQSICFVSKDGKRKCVADDKSTKVRIVELVRYEEMARVARQGLGKVMWYFDLEDENENKYKKVQNIFLVRTIYDRDNYVEEIGLFVMLIKKEVFESVCKEFDTKYMQNVVVLTKENYIVVSMNQNADFLTDTYTQINNGRDEFIDKTGRALIPCVSIDDLKWDIVTYIPYKNIYKEIGNLRTWLVIFCILTVLILSILSRMIATDLINPINRLVGAMKTVKKGRLVDVEVDRDDELGFITKTYNEMAMEIEHLLTWNYREQLTRKEAQLKALQSQINPHFLFNTLESINWMAHLNNVPEISETVSALSSLMEASIGRDDKLITLREEFLYIDNYISILKRRFEDGIQLIKWVETEDILNIKIPKLLIQPLIENAVYHGIERTTNKGIINLNAFIIADMLIIKVIDNGMGMDEEELKILNENLSMDNNTYFRTIVKKDRKSIGLENVNRRIKLFYGEKFGIRIESKKGSFTKVLVSIPAIKIDNKAGNEEETKHYVL